jgi:hypothetical protein
MPHSEEFGTSPLASSHANVSPDASSLVIFCTAAASAPPMPRGTESATQAPQAFVLTVLVASRYQLTSPTHSNSRRQAISSGYTASAAELFRCFTCDDLRALLLF